MNPTLNLPPNSPQLIEKLHIAANAYKNICNKDCLYIALSKNMNNIFMFECRYLPRHFQHLCGIDSKTYTAEDFYKTCLKDDSSITLDDCTPSRNHTLTERMTKTNALISFLDNKNLKAARTGVRINGIGNIDFDYAIGQENFLGYKSYKYDHSVHKCFPLTNMIGPISNYCTNPQRLSLVLSKSTEKEKYDTVEYEVSKNLIGKLDDGVFKALSEFMDENLIALKSPSIKQNMLEDEIELE